MAEGFSGSVAGASDEERAARVAGALAEAGIGVMRLRDAGGAVRELQARYTDLPGVLRTAGVGTVVEVADGSVRVTIERGRWVWGTDDEVVARGLGGTG